jgi:DNA-binding LacI/PurR family transcriptional regulator
MQPVASPQQRQQTLKHRRIFEHFRNAIQSGRYEAGQKLPSESELIQAFSVSRITINRALRDLQNGGFIERKAGSGTFVLPTPATGLTFGLLIPELGQTEIFEPICTGMTAAAGSQHVLMWGRPLRGASDLSGQAVELCHQLVSKRVAGVFFAPIELTRDSDRANRSVVAALENAQIPIVLLDRDLETYPNRSRYDLVGIDNRRAGHVLTRHLLAQGCRRLVFFCLAHSAATVHSRVSGFHDAIASHGADAVGRVMEIDSTGAAALERIVSELHPDGVICANDATAARVLQSLEQLGLDVPGDVRLVGIDDVKYASLLKAPLTTIHQPCERIGEAAMQAMLTRIAEPDMPGRDILLNFHLVVRKSCGSKSSPEVIDSSSAKTTKLLSRDCQGAVP